MGIRIRTEWPIRTKRNTVRDRTSPLRGALIWAAALSVALCWLPLIGPFIAGLVGGRKARESRDAFVAGVVPAVLWGLALWIVTGRQVTIGKDTFALAPLAPLAPATALALLGGALVGARSRGARSLGVLLALGGAVWVGIRVNEVRATLAPLLQKPPAPSGPSGTGAASCEENLKKLYGALSLYAGSWDDCLPPAGRWATALEEESGRADDLRCPQAPRGLRGYAMNEALGGKQLGQIKNKAETPLVFDSTLPGDNPAGTIASLPAPGRHGGKNYVLYADGSVRPR